MLNDATRPVTTLDPIEMEIIHGRLQAISDEMGIALSRSSMSPVIYEIRDFSCGICAADGQLISQANGITAFTGIFSNVVRSVRKKHGPTIMAGDIFITNDPYAGSTHTADVMVIKPIFFEAQLVAFVVAAAHWTDLGGSVAGSLSPQATEIFHEGLRLTNLRIFRGGIRQEDVFDIIAANVRLPAMSLGDLNAQIAGVRIGDLRMREICEAYGPDTLRQAIQKILVAGEAASRRAIAALPEGTYSARDWIDGDGASDEPIPIALSIIVKPDRLIFDFSGSSPQRNAPLNCAVGALEAAVKTVFKAIVDPGGALHDGWFRPIKVQVPDGTIFSAKPPAPTGWYYEVTAHASDLVWKAFASIIPSRLSAGSYLSLCVTYIGGTDPANGAPFILVEPHLGGWGATAQADGENALIALTDGETYNYPVELFEAKFPFRINEYGLNIAGSSGQGKHRGGLGIMREYEVLADDAFVFASFGRSVHKPWSINGGGEGSVNAIELIRDGRIAVRSAAPGRQISRPDGRRRRVRRTAGSAAKFNRSRSHGRVHRPRHRCDNLHHCSVEPRNRETSRDAQGQT
jgi:N-methylhydantoinase B